MLDINQAGQHSIVNKKATAQRLNRARKQLITVVRLIHNKQVEEAGPREDAPGLMQSVRVMLEELLSESKCDDGLEILDMLNHGRSFHNLRVIAAKAGDWFESLCVGQRRIQISDLNRQSGRASGLCCLPIPCQSDCLIQLTVDCKSDCCVAPRFRYDVLESYSISMPPSA